MSAISAYTLLKAGKERITFRPRGNSMAPLITDKQPVTVRRLTDQDQLAVGDIVLARVAGNIYLHKISAVDGDRIQISNNHGRVNGWTNRGKIAGIMEMT